MTGVENTIPDAVIIIFLDGFRLSGSICTIAIQHSVNLLSLLFFMHPLLMSHERRHNSGRFSYRLGSGFLELLLVVHVVFQCLDWRDGVLLGLRLRSNLYIGSMLQWAGCLLYLWLLQSLVLSLLLIGFLQGLSFRLGDNSLTSIWFLHIDGKWDHLMGFGLFGCTSFSFLKIGATHHCCRDFMTAFYFKGDLVLGLLHLQINVVRLLNRFRLLNLKVHDLMGPISFWNF